MGTRDLTSQRSIQSIIMKTAIIFFCLALAIATVSAKECSKSQCKSCRSFFLMDLQNSIVPENVDFVTFVLSTQLLKSVVLSVSKELLRVPKLATREKPSVLTASADCLIQDKIQVFEPFILVFERII